MKQIKAYKLICVLVALLFSLSWGQATRFTGDSIVYNWSGWLDTMGLQVQSDSADTTDSFNFADYPYGFRLLVLMDDSASEGFASDSIQIQLSYQTWSQCLNFKNTPTVDICAGQTVVIDTFKTADLGAITMGTTDSSTGLPTLNLGIIDTLLCDSAAVWSGFINPYYDQYGRFIFKGLTGNKVGNYIRFRLQIIRKLFNYFNRR